KAGGEEEELGAAGRLVTVRPAAEPPGTEVGHATVGLELRGYLLGRLRVGPNPLADHLERILHDDSFRILTPSNSPGRSCPPHSSHPTATADENGALQLGQRARSSPPHCGHSAGSSPSSSSK